MAPVTPAALQIEPIVDGHKSNHSNDHTAGHGLHPVHQPMPPRLRDVMHPALGKTRLGARMALPAGLPEIGRVDRGEGATRWPDLVVPMTASAVRHPAVTGGRCPAVEKHHSDEQSLQQCLAYGARRRSRQNHSRTPATKARWAGWAPSRVRRSCVSPKLSFQVKPIYGANSRRIS